MKVFKKLDEVKDEGFIKDFVLSAIENYISSHNNDDDEDGFEIEVEDGHYVQKNCVTINISKDDTLLYEFCIQVGANWCNSPDVLNKYR